MAEPADRAIDTPTKLWPTEPVEADLPTETNASEAAPNDGLGANDVYSSAKIGRRNISDVGLAAIGVGDTGNSQLDSLIWRGTSARDAVFLLQNLQLLASQRRLPNLLMKLWHGNQSRQAGQIMSLPTLLRRAWPFWQMVADQAILPCLQHSFPKLKNGLIGDAG